MTAAVHTTTDPDGPVVATVEPDPFAPDVTMWPEPPDWLFPAIIVLVVVTAITITVLAVLWIKSVRVQRAEAAQRPKTEWVDLSKLDKKGRWEDSDHNPRAGGIDRKD